MKDQKSIMIDLEDPRSGKIAEVISNKTAKKILGILTEKEKSTSEIASELNIPVNTVSYNIENMIEAGLIEKKRYLWSVKGRKIEYYKIANRRIIIEPKRMIQGVIPIFVATLLVAILISQYNFNNYNADYKSDQITQTSSESIMTTQKIAPSQQNSDSAIYYQTTNVSPWAWFLMGSWVSLLILVLWNWRKT